MKYTLLVTPVGKPTMTAADRWKKRPAVLRYFDYCDSLREAAEEQGFVPPEAGACVWFHLPMPASWSKAKRARMVGTPHQQRPDTSNLLKAFEDALLKEDSAIWHYAGLGKFWAEEGRIEVEIIWEEMKSPTATTSASERGS